MQQDFFSSHPWGKQRSPQKHDLPREVSARDEAMSSIHTLLSVSALQLANICDTLCCSQPSLSPGIVKDPLDMSQFISATNRHKTDKLLARVREMWQREFGGGMFSNPKLGKLRQALAPGDEHTGMWFLFPAVSLRCPSCPITWQFAQSTKTLQNVSGAEIFPYTFQNQNFFSTLYSQQHSCHGHQLQVLFPLWEIETHRKITSPCNKPTLRKS